MGQQYGTPQYRRYRQANRYGMSVSQLNAMWVSQDGNCSICKLPLPERFVVDHDPECCDHSSKKNTCGKCNRSIMCQRCNLYVGHIEGAIYDNVLDRILLYLGHASNDPNYDPNKPLKD